MTAENESVNQKPELPAKLLFSRAEAEDLLLTSPKSLDRIIARRMLKTVRRGRRVLIHRTELERVIAAGDIPARRLPFR
jgi:hypothetical protein